jgi:hypothetical protein
MVLARFFNVYFIEFMVIYQNWLFENFENQQVTKYILRFIIAGYLSFILKFTQHQCQEPPEVPCEMLKEPGLAKNQPWF